MVVALSIVFVYGIFFWPDTEKPKTPDNVPTTEPISRSIGTRVKYKDKGQTVFELEAKSIVSGAGQITAIAEGVTRAIYYRDGKPLLTMKAERVELRQMAEAEATGQVSATGADGFSVQAERVLWSRPEQRLSVPSPVVATLRGNKFTAPELSYDLKNKVLLCPRTATAQVGGLTIESGGLEYEVTGGIVRCPQNVKAYTPNLSVESSGVTYEIKNGVLTCPQSVTVQSGGAILRGGSAVVNTRSRRVKLGSGVQINVPPGAAVEQLKNLPSQLPLQ